MIQVRNLTLIHRKDLRELVSGLSFSLDSGDRAALIGEEGNGKSTLLKAILDSRLVEEYVEVSGEIITNGARIGYLPQEAPADVRAQSVGEYFGAIPASWEQTPRELAGLARQFALTPDFFYSEQPVRTLSGGERVKMQLAGLLLAQPDILLLDEPSNDLDLATVAWLEQFLLTCGLPLLYISHDELLLARTANKIIHLEQLRRKTRTRHTVVRMGYTEYVEQRLQGFERQEQLAAGQRREYRKQQERFRQIEQKVEHRQNTISRQDPAGGRLLKKKMHALKAQERRFEKENGTFAEFPEAEEAMYIRFPDTCAVPNGKTVCDLVLPRLTAGERGLSEAPALRVVGPEKVCIVGRNGCGKTTFLKELAIRLRERSDLRVAYMPQNYADEMDFAQTPVEFLRSTGDREEESRIRTYLGSMRYTADEMGHAIAELSGGQKAKLFLLKLSLGGCEVLLLDEPTRNFSPLSNPVIRRTLCGFGGAIISVSHDRAYIREVCDTVYELRADGLHRLEKDTLF